MGMTLAVALHPARSFNQRFLKCSRGFFFAPALDKLPYRPDIYRTQASLPVVIHSVVLALNGGAHADDTTGGDGGYFLS